MPVCPDSPSYEGSVFWDNCIGTYSWSNGDKYIGEWKNDQMHGQGNIFFGSGNKYIGEWKHNKRDGHGTAVWANGDKYVGEWKNDFKHGFGTAIWSNGNKYAGEWQNDQQHGQGNFIWTDSRVWNGKWEDGSFIDGKKYAAGEFNNSSKISNLPICKNSPQIGGDKYWDDCIGKYTWDSESEWRGDHYEGAWKDNIMHGSGTYTFANGNIYIGELINGKRHGQGTAIWSNGDKYEGNWINDLRNGYGISISVSGNKYLGEHKEGFRHGQGTYIWADGSVWEGIWKDGELSDGKRYAIGEYNYSNNYSNLPNCPGSPALISNIENTPFWSGCYGIINFDTGEFKGHRSEAEYLNNMKNGQGIYTWPNGDKYEGEWVDDIIQGKGTITYANGEIYSGELFNEMRNGYGTYSWPDGTIWKGEWKDDKWISGEQYSSDIDNTPTEENNKNTNPNDIINAASGSGFVVSSTGHIITNNHVIDGCNEVKIHYNGEQYRASIIAKDEYNDLALLKSSFLPKIIFPIKNGNAELLEDIYVSGYPFGEFFNSSVKITKGIVSSLSGFQNNFSNMQIDAALQPGNSGGPVIDHNGNVVGVAVAKLDLSTMIEFFNSVPENINFAIKSSVLLNFLTANGVKTIKASDNKISRSDLSERITKGTLFLSCWMTAARIEDMKSQKVLFNKLID